MAEQFQNNESNLSIRSKFNRNANETSTNTQTIASLTSTLTQAVARIADIENGMDTTPAPSTSDGALTNQTYDYHDAFNYIYQTTGSSGQRWTKANSIAGFSGIGYATLNNIAAVAGTEGVVTLGGLAEDTTQPRVQVPRKVWARLYFPGGSQTLVGKSDTGDPASTITATSNNSWDWYEIAADHPAYDNSYEFFGRDINVLVDGIILTTTSNTITPTGQDGFRDS